MCVEYILCSRFIVTTAAAAAVTSLRGDGDRITHTARKTHYTRAASAGGGDRFLLSALPTLPFDPAAAGDLYKCILYAHNRDPRSLNRTHVYDESILCT